MRRFALAALVAVATMAGCSSRASEEDCEQAITNIRKLTGQTHTNLGADRQAAVRACRSQSSPDTVECMAEARTREELFGCGGKIAEQIEKAMKKAEANDGAEDQDGEDESAEDQDAEDDSSADDDSADDDSADDDSADDGSAEAGSDAKSDEQGDTGTEGATEGDKPSDSETSEDPSKSP